MKGGAAGGISGYTPVPRFYVDEVEVIGVDGLARVGVVRDRWGDPQNMLARLSASSAPPPDTEPPRAYPVEDAYAVCKLLNEGEKP